MSAFPPALVQEAFEALTSCAEDLEAEIRARYSDEMLAYPVMSRRFQRDMGAVYEARRVALMLQDFGARPKSAEVPRVPRSQVGGVASEKSKRS